MPENMTLNVYWPEHPDARNSDNVSLEAPVATEAELLEFANKVREAGGGNVIPALLPSIPLKADSCLIARALNFDCEVDTIYGVNDSRSRHESGTFRWAMTIHGPKGVELSEKIGKALDLEVVWAQEPEDDFTGTRAIMLPEHIGNAAHAFDAGVVFQDLIEDEDFDVRD